MSEKFMPKILARKSEFSSSPINEKGALLGLLANLLSMIGFDNSK